MKFKLLRSWCSWAIASALLFGAADVQGATTIVTADTSGPVHKTAALALLGQDGIVVGDDEQVGGWSNSTSTHTSFGVIGALVANASGSKRERAVEVLTGPVRTALAGIDVHALALAATDHALKKVAWLSAAPVVFEKSDSYETESRFLDTSSGDQAIFIHYIYFFDPDFVALHTKILIEIAHREVPAGGKPDDRFKSKNLAYRQTIDISVLLPDARKGTNATNAAAWAENNGTLAQAGLKNAFDMAEMYLSRTLNMTQADLAGMYSKTLPKMRYDGDWGQKIDDADGHVAMWAERFVVISKIG